MPSRWVRRWVEEHAEGVISTPWGPEVGRFVARYRQETRTVIDRTLGGDVVYYSGRRPRNVWHPYNQKVTSLTEWRTWVQDATRIPSIAT